MSDCLHCDNWGCRRCLPVGGEQSPSVAELREERLKARVRELETQLDATYAQGWQEGVRVAAKWVREHPFTEAASASPVNERYERCLLGLYGMHEPRAIKRPRGTP